MARVLLPFLLVLVLLAAWACRWEKGPTKTDNSTIVVFYKDRWTHQDWVKIYWLSGFPRVGFAPVFLSEVSEEERAEHWKAAETLNTVLTVAWGALLLVSGWMTTARLRKALRNRQETSQEAHIPNA